MGGGGKVAYVDSMRKSKLRAVMSTGLTIQLSSFRYPKHVWSPAGGWYSRPANWKANTSVMGLVCLGVVGIAWAYSAENERRTTMPARHVFFPSRYWSKEIIEHDRKQDSQ